MKGPNPAWPCQRKIPLWRRTSCLAGCPGLGHGVSGQQAEGCMKTQALLCTSSISVSQSPSQVIFLMSSPFTTTTRQNLEAFDLCQIQDCSTLTPPNGIYPMAVCFISTGTVCWWPFSKDTSEEVWFVHAAHVVQSYQLEPLEKPEWLGSIGLIELAKEVS